MGAYGTPEMLDYIENDKAKTGNKNNGKKRKVKEITCPHCGEKVYVERGLTPGLFLKWVIVVSVSVLLLCFVLIIVAAVVSTIFQ